MLLPMSYLQHQAQILVELQQVFLYQKLEPIKEDTKENIQINNNADNQEQNSALTRPTISKPQCQKHKQKPIEQLTQVFCTIKPIDNNFSSISNDINANCAQINNPQNQHQIIPATQPKFSKRKAKKYKQEQFTQTLGTIKEVSKVTKK